VLNGIAFDAAEDVFYLTGKNWPLYYKVRRPFATIVATKATTNTR
jgi:glutamine cyclotransferase